MGCFGGDKTSPEGKFRYEHFDGPLEKRSCRDLFCLIIFAAFFGFMIFLFIYGTYHGDLYRLARGYDVSGNVCGRDNEPIENVTYSGRNMESKKFLRFDFYRTVEVMGSTSLSEAKALSGFSLVDMSDFSDKIAYCVEDFNKEIGSTSSSTSSTTTSVTTTTASAPAKLLDDQVDIFTHSSEARQKLTVSSEEASYYAVDLLSLDPVSKVMTGGGACRMCAEQCNENESPILSFCLPVRLGQVEETVSKYYSSTGIKDFLTDAVADIKLCWPEMIYMCLIALGLSIFIIILLRFLAAIFVYVIMALCILAFIGGTAFLWVVYHYKKEYYSDLQSRNATCELYDHRNGSATTTGSESTAAKLKRSLTEACTKGEVNNFLAAAIVATVVTAIVLLIILVMRKRIKLVVQLFREAGQAVTSMPLLLFQPIWTLLALVITFVLWVLGLAFLESTGNPEPHPETEFITYQKSTFILISRWIYLFGLLWMTQFIVACQHMVVAGAVATWYFRIDKDKLGLPIWKSVWRLIRYHLGSVAMGSFFIALVRFIRVIVHFVERRIKDNDEGLMSKPMEMCFKCCQCCLWCFEKVLKFISKNAYIEIAIHGDGFCTAARKAFSVITSNLMRVAAINSVGDLILFFAKIAVVAATIALGIVIVDNKSNDDEGLNVSNVWVPIAIGAIFAYVIADTVINIYEMTIDTIFICFCEDCEMNDGISRPYFMSRGLMAFVSNSNKALEAEKARRRERKQRRRSTSRQALIN